MSCLSEVKDTSCKGNCYLIVNFPQNIMHRRKIFWTSSVWWQHLFLHSIKGHIVHEEARLSFVATVVFYRVYIKSQWEVLSPNRRGLIFLSKKKFPIKIINSWNLFKNNNDNLLSSFAEKLNILMQLWLIDIQLSWTRQTLHMI